MGSFVEDPTNNRLTVKLPIGAKVRFIEAMSETGLSADALVIFLLDSYYGDKLETLKLFRYNLAKRVKKGLDYRYIEELQKLRELIDLSLKNL